MILKLLIFFKITHSVGKNKMNDRKKHMVKLVTMVNTEDV